MPPQTQLSAEEQLMSDQIPQVGAPDPERTTSRIFDEDEDRSLDLEQEATMCYYNSIAYSIGQYVRSGGELLHCEEGGVWVRRGETRAA
jgi:Protein of unknown function (DUF1496)